MRAVIRRRSLRLLVRVWGYAEICKSLKTNDARVAKLADAPDLGSGGEILRGSSPLPGTSTAQANAERSTSNAQRQFGLLVEHLEVRCWALEVDVPCHSTSHFSSRECFLVSHKRVPPRN